MKKEFRAHPLMIFNLMKPFLFVLVLPFIKAVLQYFISREIDSVLGLEISIFTVLALISYFRYLAYKISYENEVLTIN